MTVRSCTTLEQYAKDWAESEFEKYRIVQDRLFESDFDKEIKKIEASQKKWRQAMIPANKLNITDQIELAKAEEKLSKQKAKQLLDSGDING